MKILRILSLIAAGFVLALLLTGAPAVRVGGVSVDLPAASPAYAAGGLTVSLPAGLTNAQKQDILDAFASAYGYTGLDPSGAAETKAQHFQRRVADYIRGVYRGEKVRAAAASATTTAVTDADTVTSPL